MKGYGTLGVLENPFLPVGIVGKMLNVPNEP
jgi:hypothetical protein